MDNSLPVRPAYIIYTCTCTYTIDSLYGLKMHTCQSMSILIIVVIVQVITNNLQDDHFLNLFDFGNATSTPAIHMLIGIHNIIHTTVYCTLH